GEYGAVTASTSRPRSRAPRRTSPKRGSPWAGPLASKGEPSSGTTPTLTLAFTAQVWKARRASRRQGPRGLSLANSELPAPAIGVPSGAKLSRRWAPSGQGTPKVAGRERGSSSKSLSVRRGDIGGSEATVQAKGSAPTSAASARRERGPGLTGVIR